MKTENTGVTPATAFFSLKRIRASLRLWLGLALVTLIILLALTIAAALERIARREVMKVSSQNLENISRQMAREITFGMTRFAREVETEALLPTLRDPASSGKEMRPLLDQFVALHPEFSYVGVIDIASGVAIAANAGLFEGGSALGRPVFENGRKALFLGDVHPAVRLAELLPRLPNGDALRFLDVAAPIRDLNGATIRVLATHVSFEWTRQLREQILSPMRDARGIEALLVDSSGKVVLAPNDSIKVGTPIGDLLKNEASEGAQIQPWTNGLFYLTASSPVLPYGAFNGFGWRVVTRQPEALAMAPAKAVRSPFFLGAAFLGCLAAALAWLIANRVTQPMIALAKTASSIGSGSGEMPMVRSGIGEIDRVQETLAGLAKDRRRQGAELEDRKRRFSAFADLMPHLVFETDGEGRLEYANEQWVEQMGPYEGTTLPGLCERMLKEDRQPLRDAWERAQAEGTQLNTLVRLMVGSDQPQWFRVRARPVVGANGAVERWIGTLSNVNESVMAADRVEKALDRERAARAELERVTVMKDDFLATLSHELRTPLNVVGGWAQMLEARADDSAYVTRGAGVIRRNIELQAALISGLLDMSAIAAGKVSLDIQPVDARQLLAGTRDAFSKLASDKGVALNFHLPERPVMIQADARRMSQILSNLVANAIKFTDGTGLVRVRAWEDGELARIEVIDTGCGIAPEFLPYVFERFRQQDSSMSRKKGGVGLGLAIAKSLAELQGGKITALSDGLGKGCLFALEFPLDPAAKGEPAADKRDEPPLAKLGDARVLLVEDDADAREITRDALRTLGAAVECAEDAAAALKWLVAKEFDLLVCDIGMPGMDGYELMGRIRASADPQIAKLPAIALTAYAMRHDLARAKEVGFQRHVSKPFSLIALSAAAETVLGLGEEAVRGASQA
jgi:signal transduction histidine kinase/ActR/RegA family two-component response regulator